MHIDLNALSDAPTRKVPKEEAPPIAKDIWNAAHPNAEGLASVQEVKDALLQSHENGEILVDDISDIMTAVLDLESQGNEVNFDQFWACLSEFVDAEDDDVPLSLSAMTGTTFNSSFNSGMFNATDLLSLEESTLYDSVFQRLDVGNTKALPGRVFLNAVTKLTQHAELGADTKIFCFHLIPSIQYHMNDHPHFDFELFVTTIQEAAVNTKEDLSDPSWEPLESVHSLNENLEAAVRDTVKTAKGSERAMEDFSDVMRRFSSLGSSSDDITVAAQIALESDNDSSDDSGVATFL